MHEARKAKKQNEVPVGCVIVKNNKIISKAHNTKQKTHNCTNHAEINAIIKAERKLRDWRLDDCDLFVTLEPCKMCMEVIRQARIKRVYYLLHTNFNNEDHKIIEKKLLEDYEIYKTNYQHLLSDFFNSKR